MIRFVLAFIVAVLALPLLSAVAVAAPKGNDNWLFLEGTCNGQQLQFLDPPGGNTNFVAGGSVLIGMRFTATNIETGEVLGQSVNGKGVNEDRLVHCAFTFLDIPTPEGPIDVLFEVDALPTPQRR